MWRSQCVDDARTIEAAAAHGAAWIPAASEVHEERCIRRRLSGFGNASRCECLIDDAELLCGKRQPPDFAAFADHFNGRTLTAAEAAPDNPAGTGFEHFRSPQTEGFAKHQDELHTFTRQSLRDERQVPCDFTPLFGGKRSIGKCLRRAFALQKRYLGAHLVEGIEDEVARALQKIKELAHDDNGVSAACRRKRAIVGPPGCG